MFFQYCAIFTSRIHALLSFHIFPQWYVHQLFCLPGKQACVIDKLLWVVFINENIQSDLLDQAITQELSCTLNTAFQFGSSSQTSIFIMNTGHFTIAKPIPLGWSPPIHMLQFNLEEKHAFYSRCYLWSPVLLHSRQCGLQQPVAVYAVGCHYRLDDEAIPPLPLIISIWQSFKFHLQYNSSWRCLVTRKL